MASAPPDHERTSSRVTALLAGSAMGVYLLVTVGASTALLDGAVACPTWPACGGEWLVSPTDPAVAVTLAHRAAALLVGCLLAVTAWTCYRRGVTRRVAAALGTALVLYPVQTAVGAVTAVTGAPTALAAVHLGIAVAIFSGVILALLWRLESETADEASRSSPAESGGPTPGDADEPAATAPAADPSEAPRANLRRRALGYVRLTKPKLWWLLCLVAVAAMALAAGRSLDPGTVAATVAGGVLAIGASGTFNNVYERDVDRRMDRTADRPLVDGTIPVRRAVAFGLALTAGSVAVFVTFVNVLAAALGVLAILFYTVAYTMVLKPNTTQNIVIGGAVGAFPALIGWAAVENVVGLPAVVLGVVIFLWTPAHFYNLALAYQEDYARGGFPMLPVVRGEAVTRRHVLLYLGATMVGAVLLGATTRLGWPYATVAVVAGGGFLWAVVGLHRERTERAAFRAFHASNAYLGSLLVVVAVDALVI